MAGHVAPYPNDLRTSIKVAGFSVRKVSKETNIPESTLYDWAAGNRVIPHEERQILASLLDCEVSCLAPRMCSSSLPQTLLDREERDLPSESESTIPEREKSFPFPLSVTQDTIEVSVSKPEIENGASGLLVTDSDTSNFPTDSIAQNHIDANLTTQLLSVITDPELSHSEIQCSLEQKLEAFQQNNQRKDVEQIQRGALHIVAMNPLTSRAATNLPRFPEGVLNQYAGGLTACDYLRNGSQEDVRLASSMITNYLPVLQTIVSEVPDQRKKAAELLSHAWQIKAQMSFHFQGTERAIHDGKEAVRYARESGNRALLAVRLRWHLAKLEFDLVENTERRKQAFLAIQEARSLIEDKKHRAIPLFIQSWVYTGSAKYEAFYRMKDDMHLSLGKAEETFFASLDDKQDRIPGNVAYSHAHLLRHKAISYAYLGKQDQAHKIFMEELIDSDNSFASRLPIIGRDRLGILSEFTFTTLYLPKALKDKELSIKLWKKHLEETIAWHSESYFREAYIAYQVMNGIWSGDADVEELRDLLVHWSAAEKQRRF